MISADMISQAFSIGGKQATDSYRYATVSGVNPVRVKLGSGSTETRCASVVNVAVGDRVQICIKANGSCVVLGKV